MMVMMVTVLWQDIAVNDASTTTNRPRRTTTTTTDGDRRRVKAIVDTTNHVIAKLSSSRPV